MRESLEDLYREHRTYIFHLCLHFFRNREDAEDMTQEVFLHIARAPEGKSMARYEQFREENGCTFRTWLHRVAANLCMMRLRLEKSQHRQARLGNLLSLEGLMMEPGTAAPQPELAMTIGRAIAKMPPGYKAVATLRLYYGMEHHEIARELGYTPGCSRSQTHQAMQKLRQILSTPPGEAAHVR